MQIIVIGLGIVLRRLRLFGKERRLPSFREIQRQTRLMFDFKKDAITKPLANYVRQKFLSEPSRDLIELLEKGIPSPEEIRETEEKYHKPIKVILAGLTKDGDRGMKYIHAWRPSLIFISKKEATRVRHVVYWAIRLESTSKAVQYIRDHY